MLNVIMPGDKCKEGKSRIKEQLNKSCLHLSELNMSNVSHCENVILHVMVFFLPKSIKNIWGITDYHFPDSMLQILFALNDLILLNNLEA